MWGRQPLVATVLDKPLDNPRMEQRGLGLTDLLVSQRVHAGVEHLVLSSELRDLHLKGFSRPTTAYEIVGLNSAPVHT
jgi:class 3 adenylate cyclase